MEQCSKLGANSEQIWSKYATWQGHLILLPRRYLPNNNDKIRQASFKHVNPLNSTSPERVYF